MITLKLAWRSVFRRPVQNLAVIIGITLGVSLFVGIQVGSQSLGQSFGTVAEHSLGRTEAKVDPLLWDFFLTQETLQDELSAINPLIPPHNQSRGSLAYQLRQNESVMEYVEALTERIETTATVVYEDTGSIEVSQVVKGIPVNETGFGKLYNSEGKILEISSLAMGEVYLGRDSVSTIFGDVDPIGKNLTFSTSFFSVEFANPNSSLSITPKLITVNTSVRIVDIFEDRGLGEELFSGFIATSLDWMQGMYRSALLDARAKQDPVEKQLNPIIGYGDYMINTIRINFKDKISTDALRDVAFNETRDAIKEQLGGFGDLYIYSNSLNDIHENIADSIENISLLLNVFGSLIAFAAVLVIINIQSMALQAREKETGIQRAIGANRRQIIVSNMLESLFLGLIGSVLGVGGGYLYGEAMILFLSWSFGFDSSLITLVFTTDIITTSFFWGMVISLTTGLLPAINASRINVAQVLRGITPPQSVKIGKKSLYFGMLITILGLVYAYTLDPNPFVQGKDAFLVLEDSEQIYLPIALVFLGPSLLFAYFKSKKWGLTIASIGLMSWAYINIFVIFNWIETSNGGGLLYVAYVMFSLIGGSILFVSSNLDTLASLGEKTFSWMVRNRKSPIRGTTMVAFRQMRSKKVRSTLTFALFATILTLNIFIGSWSYSTRYGFDEVIQEISGNTDVSIISSQPIERSIGFTQRLMDEFGKTDREVYLEYMKPVTVSKISSLYYNTSDGGLGEFERFALGAVDEDFMWSDALHSQWQIRFDLDDNKTGTPFEFMEDVQGEPIANIEDEKAWEAALNGTMIDGKPLIITETIGSFEFGSGLNIIAVQGDSIYLNTTDGGLQEFLVASIITSNPLTSIIRDMTHRERGHPTGSIGIVARKWAENLTMFSGKIDTEEIFIGKSNLKEINDQRLVDFLLDVEFWANAREGAYRKETGKIHGVYGLRVYSIYERFLEGQYRFFNFLQAYVSLGFLVGILGLLVVASRSVAERKRQIGMLRALGFRRGDVVASVVLELVVTGFIGLILGIINGTVMGYALTTINSNGEATFLIPWLLILGYGALTFISAIIAAILPGISASRIPPSDALRYTG